MTNTRFTTCTTILFDAGNTLAYVDLARVERLFEEAGVPRSPEELAAAERRARSAMYRQSEAQPDLRDRERWDTYMHTMFEEVGVRDAHAASALNDRLQEVHRNEHLWRAVPSGTHGVLGRLRDRGYRLGVVSNSDGRVPQLLEELDLARHFETIVDSHLVGVEKPDPRIFHIALEAMNVPAASAAYVGDFVAIDVVGAERAGLLPVLLDPLGIARNAPCPVIRALDDLESLLPERSPGG